MANILLVEDDEGLRKSMSRLLSCDHTVTAVENGVEALRELQTGSARFDLIISDYEMPEMDGVELLEQVKSNPRFASAPFLLQSGRDDDWLKRRVEEAGATFCDKGAALAEFRECLERMLAHTA